MCFFWLFILMLYAILLRVIWFCILSFIMSSLMSSYFLRTVVSSIYFCFPSMIATFCKSSRLLLSVCSFPELSTTNSSFICSFSSTLLIIPVFFTSYFSSSLNFVLWLRKVSIRIICVVIIGALWVYSFLLVYIYFLWSFIIYCIICLVSYIIFLWSFTVIFCGFS